MRKELRIILWKIMRFEIFSLSYFSIFAQ